MFRLAGLRTRGLDSKNGGWSSLEDRESEAEDEEDEAEMEVKMEVSTFRLSFNRIYVSTKKNKKMKNLFSREMFIQVYFMQ